MKSLTVRVEVESPWCSVHQTKCKKFYGRVKWSVVLQWPPSTYSNDEYVSVSTRRTYPTADAAMRAALRLSRTKIILYTKQKCKQ